MKSRWMTVAALGAIAVSVPLIAARPVHPDEDAIRRVVGYYFDGGTAGDSTVVGKAFHN